jgi:thiamine pyrophosphate-dependent acetolactate synthase large subunit-like protein
MSFDIARAQSFRLRRRAVVAAILKDIGDSLLVTGLGAPTWDAAAAGDRDLTFPLWGAMGGAVPIGLGLALAQPKRRVLVLTGDGEMLMGIGSLATVAAMQPANLAIAVLDNERYGETGGQPTHTAGATDLAAFAQAAGIGRVSTVRDEAGLAGAINLLLREPGPVFVTIKVLAEDLPLVLPPKDGTELRTRFRKALRLG